MIFVYNKNSPVHSIHVFLGWLVIPVIFTFVLIIAVYDNTEIGSSPILLTVLAIGGLICAAFGLFRILNDLPITINNKTLIKLDENDLTFLDTQLSIDNIDQITIRIRHVKPEKIRIGNNTIIIKSRFNDYILGLIISNPSDLELLEELVSNLKNTGLNVNYINYLYE